MQHEELAPTDWPTESFHPATNSRTAKSASFADDPIGKQEALNHMHGQQHIRDNQQQHVAENILLDDEFYENDSELGDDLHIDEAGNVLSHDDFPVDHIRGLDGHNNSSMAHILAGYGTDICEQLIAEFM